MKGPKKGGVPKNPSVGGLRKNADRYAKEAEARMKRFAQGKGF